MGRFSSVQAFADNHASMRSISYEQATGRKASAAAVAAASTGSSGGKEPPAVHTEKVINPYGSTAGAGSGEFHVYRHARAREQARLEQLTKEEQERLKDLEFQQKLQQYQQESVERTAKRRKKRQRHKEAQIRRKNLALAGIRVDDTSDQPDDEDNKNKSTTFENDQDEEDEMIGPVAAAEAAPSGERDAGDPQNESLQVTLEQPGVNHSTLELNPQHVNQDDHSALSNTQPIKPDDAGASVSAKMPSVGNDIHELENNKDEEKALADEDLRPTKRQAT